MVFDLPTVLTWRMVLFPTNNVYLKYSISLGLEVNLIFYLIFQLCLFEIRPPSPVASRTPPAHLARSSTTPTQSSMLRRDGNVCVRRSSQKALWTKCKKKTVGFCEGLEITWCFGLISPSYICETRFFVVDSKTFLFFVYFFLSCVFGGVEGEREREKRKLPLTPVFRGQTAFRGITAPPRTPELLLQWYLWDKSAGRSGKCVTRWARRKARRRRERRWSRRLRSCLTLSCIAWSSTRPMTSSRYD